MQSIFILILPLLLSKTAAAPRVCRLEQLAFVAGSQIDTRCGRCVLHSCRPSHDASTTDADTDLHSSQQSNERASHIVSITSKNIAGMKNEVNNDDIIISFTRSDEYETAAPGFVAVTGESGSGKSLLVSKAIDLITGGKAGASLLPPAGFDMDDLSESCVELVANLSEPHLSAVSSSLEHFGVDPRVLYNEQLHGHQLHLSRTFQRSSDASGRMKSICRINGRHVSLKTLRSVSSPLFTRVDVATASAALSKSSSRLAMIDVGVSDVIKRKCIQCRGKYERAKKKRRKIETDLEERVLPVGMQRDRGPVSEDDMELLQHWVDELDAFESRVNNFREAILGQFNEHLLEIHNTNDNANECGILVEILRNIQSNTWADAVITEDSSLFTNLLEFREEIKAVETQMTAAHTAYEMLSSLSSPGSASVAIEKVRKLLYSLCREDSGPLFDSIEKTHELLNDVEAALSDCARSIDGDSNSVLSTLEKMVCTGISLEQIDTIVADWNVLARKHGLSPYTLPKCHMSLRQELNGNAEALMLLPQAIKEEQLALEQYSEACRELSDERKRIADSLSLSVTELLPSLGLESSFRAELDLRHGGFEDPYCGSDGLGVDIANFLLLHQKSNKDIESQSGGYIDQVGSSGEKSRVLLAIETILPGSIGTTCNAYSSSLESATFNVPPLAIIYDEIDAHVGGRAAVTMAKLLADQTRQKPEIGIQQIIAITHCASVAAIADHHIVVERTAQKEESSSKVRAFSVHGSSRRKEIARMTSGDLAAGEAEAFADALIRDALLQRGPV